MQDSDIRKMIRLIPILPLLACVVCHGQAMQRQIEDLSGRMELLERDNRRLEKELRLRDSIEYTCLRLEIFETYTRMPELYFDFHSTVDKISVTGLFARLMQANNPSSDILGFRFTDIVMKACERHFLAGIEKQKERMRLSQVIGKIINNPIVSSLAGTNPVTSVVAGIISAIAGFSTSEAEVRTEGNRIRGIEISNESVVGQDALSGFTREMQVYITFYDALIRASQNYIEGLNQLKAGYSQLIRSIALYRETLYQDAEVTGDNVMLSLSNLLPDPTVEQLDYAYYLHSEKHRRMLLHAREYPGLRDLVSEFRKEYNALLFTFLNEYLDALGSALAFPEGTVDPARISELEKEIRDFLTDYCSMSQGGTDVTGE